jgi:hypothetical protein
MHISGVWPAFDIGHTLDEFATDPVGGIAKRHAHQYLQHCFSSSAFCFYAGGKRKQHVAVVCGPTALSADCSRPLLRAAIILL